MALWIQALVEGVRLARRAKTLLLVPLALDLLVLLVLGATEGLPEAPLALALTLPVALPSVFQVHGPQDQVLPFDPLHALPDLGEMSLVLLLLVLVLQSFLAAGYLGRLEAIRGSRRVGFVAGGSRFFSRLLAYHALVTFLLLAAAPSLRGLHGLGPGALFVLAAVLALLYALFLTPFAIAVDDLPFSAALRRSVELAFHHAPQVAPYVVAYAALTLLLSGGVHLLALLGPAGLLAATLLTAAVGTALVASTLHLYAALRPREVLPTPVPRPLPAEEPASA